MKLIPLMTSIAITSNVGIAGAEDNLETQSEVLAKAHKIVSKPMKDPSSAQWSDEFLVQGKDTDGNALTSVCGQVNMKNSFGGYVGNSRYIVVIVASQDVPIDHIYNDADFPSTYNQTWININGVYKFLPSMIENEGNRAVFTSWHSSKYKREQSRFEISYWNKLCVDGSHPMTFMGD